MKSTQLNILFLISTCRCIYDQLKLCHGHPYFRDSYSVTSIPSTTIWFVLSRRLTLRRDKLTYYCPMGRIPLFVLVPMFVFVQIYTGQSPLFYEANTANARKHVIKCVHTQLTDSYTVTSHLINFDYFSNFVKEYLLGKTIDSYCNIVLVHSYLMVFKIHDEFYEI